MSVPELPYSVSDHPLDYLRKTTKSIDKLRSYLNKLHEKDQYMYNYMVRQLITLLLQVHPYFKLTVKDHCLILSLLELIFSKELLKSSEIRYMSGIKRSTMVLSASFKMLSFKFKPSSAKLQSSSHSSTIYVLLVLCLSLLICLLILQPISPPGRLLSCLILLLILILSRQ